MNLKYVTVMKKCLAPCAVVLAAAFAFSACGSKVVKIKDDEVIETKTGKRYETEGGIVFEILKKGEGRAAQLGDYITCSFKVSCQDQLVGEMPEPGRYLQIMDPHFPGDLNEGLLYLHEGDSALILVSVDSMKKYMYTMEYPEYLKGFLEYRITIHKLQSMEEVMQEEAMAEESATAAQADAIENYLAENKLNVKPDENGLYYIQTRKGKGALPAAGQTVAINYVGKFLNGKVFDTNIEEVAKENGMYIAERPYRPMEFQVANNEVIPGFDYTVQKMNRGSMATVIIPFQLGYGSHDLGTIPPFSTLVFDIEMVDIR